MIWNPLEAYVKSLDFVCLQGQPHLFIVEAAPQYFSKTSSPEEEALLQLRL